MRLKRTPRPQEETFLVHQRNLNKQYGEKLSTFRQPSVKSTSQERLGIHQGWSAFPTSLSRRQSSPTGADSATNGNYSPTLASPLEDGSDQAMSLSSPEDNSRHATSEEDSLSDLEYSETSPLLAVSSCGEDGSASDDCNNNDLFSDSSDMSDHSKECFHLENTYNNNNSSFLDLFSSSDKKFSEVRKHVLQERNTPGRLPSGDKMAPFPVPKPNLPDVLPLEVAANNSSAAPVSPDLNDIMDDDDASELNINMATQAFNDFSMPSSKHSDIQCLVQDKGANIREAQPRCLPDCLVEPKILNTGDSLPKNMTKEYQHQLMMSRGNTSARDTPNESSWKADFDSALSGQLGNRNVDNKPYLPRSRGSTMIEYFARDSRIPPGEVVETPCPKRDSGGIKDLFKIMDIPLSHMSPRSTNDKGAAPEVKETTGPANMTHVRPARQWDVNTQAEEGEEEPLEATTGLEDTQAAVSDDNCNNNAATRVSPEGSRKYSVAPSTDTPKTSQKDPSPELLGDFDVFNIETAMPTIDWAAMEAHLARAAKEDDWLLRVHPRKEIGKGALYPSMRQNDREEIRRKLAMDSDNEEYYCGERVTRKPSLTTRLQSGMNLQICFMNETASDQESQGSDHDTEGVNNDGSSAQHVESKADELCPEPVSSVDKNLNKSDASNTNINNNNDEETRLQSLGTKRQRPSFFFNRQRSWRLGHLCTPQQKKVEGEKGIPEEDFYTRHARLQAEARLALAQAKDMARMQMEVEKQRKKKSPIAEIVGLPFPDGRHRLSRQVLAEMNVAQLQVIVNDLHSQIESLNEDLVRLLLERDDLHMEQDSMLVDIEDLTRYLGAKDEALRNQQNAQLKKLKSCKK